MLRLFCERLNISMSQLSQKNNSPDFFSINSTKVNETEMMKFLGLYIDNTLSLAPHCKHILNNLNTKCYQIRVIINVLNIFSLIQFYYAHIYSIIKNL